MPVATQGSSINGNLKVQFDFVPIQDISTSTINALTELIPTNVPTTQSYKIMIQCDDASSAIRYALVGNESGVDPTAAIGFQLNDTYGEKLINVPAGMVLKVIPTGASATLTVHYGI